MLSVLPRQSLERFFRAKQVHRIGHPRHQKCMPALNWRLGHPHFLGIKPWGYLATLAGGLIRAFPFNKAKLDVNIPSRISLTCLLDPDASMLSNVPSAGLEFTIETMSLELCSAGPFNITGTYDLLEDHNTAPKTRASRPRDRLGFRHVFFFLIHLASFPDNVSAAPTRVYYTRPAASRISKLAPCVRYSILLPPTSSF